MGLRPLDPARWLEVDDLRPAELTRKHELLHADADGVVATLPGSEEAGRELLDAVVAHLEVHHPGLVATGPAATILERSTGSVIDTRRLHPVDAAGRLVQEDLCLMTLGADGWILAAASVCFPSRWRLADKIGRGLPAIHAPVPGYAESLERPTRLFFDRLRPERPVWRLNWTLLDSAALHQPDAGGRLGAGTPLVDPGGQLWFRVERQTLRRLSDRPAVTFTIRTYVCPLGRLVATHPEVADALRATLATVPGPSRRYKGWDDLVPAVLTWLDDPQV
jgi:hypothetical protein